MRGAREYAELFGREQHGKLYLVPGSHARGRTFHIYILPSAEPLDGSVYSCKDAIEVYGIVSGQPGWTESYDWLHRGRWEEDFAKVVSARREELAARENAAHERNVAAQRERELRTQKLLDSY